MTRISFPVRFLLWVLFDRAEGREARITYYAHRATEKRAA